MMFDHTYAALPDGFFAPVTPEPAAAPELVAWNKALARELGLDHLADDDARLARLFGGTEVLPGSRPIAMAYAGHQFGHLVPQLGDGRAALLGEVVTDSGQRFDVQLKGSGRTPFSRRGDGKSWLGPVLREYILSEAMHRLGVPTTRALAAVATGETVLRESPLPGAVFTRVASSHLRVGTFQFFAVREDVASLRILADYAIGRHYPEAATESEPYAELLGRVVERQAQLIAHWMSVGFIHGVMNTDNTSISGETIDYGPAAFMDEFRFDKVFSSIDSYGRYAYGNQASIAQWNLARLADTLLLAGADKASLEAALDRFAEHYESCYLELMAPKLGILDAEEEDIELIVDWLRYLDENGLDYTLSLRELSTRIDSHDRPQFGEFESRWRRRIKRSQAPTDKIESLMDSVNPLFIPRNHRVEQAIEAAVQGDYTVFNELNTVLQTPFSEHIEFSQYASAPEPSERVTRTFCGT
ncbi:MAG: YdiU family protein [Pseudomonadota bacterium]